MSYINLGWENIKEEKRKQKEERLDNFDPKGWVKHNDVHFSKIINGSKLDYWPTTTRYRYKGKAYFGKQKPIQKFIEEQLNQTQV